MGSEVTLKQIAEALGVSAMTVSRALNDKDNVDDKTRKKIVDKAHEMGYTPNHVAKSLVSSKTYTIGVVIPEITHAFFPEVVRGIEEVTYASDYHLFLINANEDFEREKKAIRALRSKRVDGILISSSRTVENDAFYKNLVNTDLDIVFFDRCVENVDASCVRVNDRASAAYITNHLIEEHNYTRLAHLSGPREVSIGKKRMLGFRDSLEENGLEINEDWIITSGFREEEGRKAMKELLSKCTNEYPEAVVCVNDPAAIGAMRAIEEAGLSIPDDIAITGFTDDIRAPLLNTPLTTVHQPAYEVGKRAAKKLLDTINNPDEPAENIEVLTSLMIRESCGCS